MAEQEFKQLKRTITSKSRQLRRNFGALALASLFLTANIAVAQFTAGPNPITGNNGYTVQVRGNPESTGIGVVQVYFLE